MRFASFWDPDAPRLVQELDEVAASSGNAILKFLKRGECTFCCERALWYLDIETLPTADERSAVSDQNDIWSCGDLDRMSATIVAEALEAMEMAKNSFN